jgi:hypothetical protein
LAWHGRARALQKPRYGALENKEDATTHRWFGGLSPATGSSEKAPETLLFALVRHDVMSSDSAALGRLAKLAKRMGLSRKAHEEGG